MTGIFSFIQPPIINLLEMSGKVLPGIEKAIALFYDTKSANNQARICHNPTNNTLIEDLFILDNNLLNELRIKNKQLSWLTAKNLPFETTEYKKTQLNIFDEYENTVLCLPFKNNYDNKYDLLFLYLNNNKANFGLANSEIPLTTSEKEIIGKTLHNSMHEIYQRAIIDSEVLVKMNSRYQNILEENAKLQAEIEILKTNFNHSQVAESKRILKIIGQRHNIILRFSKDAIEKLQGFSGSFSDLKQSIEESAINAINSNYGLNCNEIELNQFDIHFIVSDKSINKNIEINIPSRYNKTIQLLDKLENAAKIVIDGELKLTSENVGNACPIPISAPAISDALKNHHKKVLKLMTDYPDRWPLIKSEFRPIKNILWSNTG